MAGKTLSNGTLALRFMQNAQRVKQEEITSLKRKEVKDEAEWEVSKELREAWGISSKSQDQRQLHEPSYLPFLFPSLQATQVSSEQSSIETEKRPKLAGRRSFSKGKEVIQKESTDPSISSVDECSSGVEHEKNDGYKPTEASSASIRMRSSRHHPLIGRKASQFANRDALGGSDKLSTKLEGSSSDAPVLNMISGETPANVGLDMRTVRKAVLRCSSGDAAEANLDFSTRGLSHDTGSIISGAEMNTKKKASTMAYIRPAGVDAPVVKADVQITKKVKKRTKDQADSLKSEGSEQKIGNRSNLLHSDEQHRGKKARSTRKDDV